MEKDVLYKRIADSFRVKILSGEIQAGERLPSLRELAAEWDCTVGTAQHAYQDLADQGLIISRPGQGTRVVETPLEPGDGVLRRAELIHKAEAFLLEVLTSGYEPDEVESAVRVALDRWREVAETNKIEQGGLLRFSGSHDLALTWLAAQFQEVAPDTRLVLSFTGSLAGLMDLAKGEADLAGSHLWDSASGVYNEAFIRRMFPGQRIALVTLAQRWLGWIVQPGNPLGIQKAIDLTGDEVHFVNRRQGSGTRLRLDAILREAGISPEEIDGYDQECGTHSAVAQTVADGEAGVGFGLGAAARVFGLEFIRVVKERYDLVLPEATYESQIVNNLLNLIRGKQFSQMLAELGDYDPKETGQVHWVEPG